MKGKRKGKKKGDTHLAMLQRRERVKQLVLHEARLDEIVEAMNNLGIRVHENTIRKDVDAIFVEWRENVAIRDMWNHKMSFDLLKELDRQYWGIFHQKPREIPIGKHMVTEDRSFIKVHVLDSLSKNVQRKNIMAGIGTIKVFEQLRYLESERSRGFELTRISIEDEEEAGARRLQEDLDLQRRVGMIREATDIREPKA